MIERMEQAVTLRACQPDDLRDVARIWAESWLSTGAAMSAAPSNAELEQRLAHEGVVWRIYLASFEQRTVGFVASQQDWLRQMFVAPTMIGKGVGTLLLDLAKREMPEGFWLRTDVGNVRARRFYERRGLRLLSEGPHPVHGHCVATYCWDQSSRT